jgi:catechol 2,3-dioxygenase
VRDVPRASAFYRDLLGFTEIHVDDGIAELIMGETKLVLLRTTAEAAAPEQLHFGFRATDRSDVDDWGRRAQRAGAAIESGPAPAEWGGYAVYLRDPDSYLIEIWAEH